MNLNSKLAWVRGRIRTRRERGTTARFRWRRGMTWWIMRAPTGARSWAHGADPKGGVLDSRAGSDRKPARSIRARVLRGVCAIAQRGGASFVREFARGDRL